MNQITAYEDHQNKIHEKLNLALFGDEELGLRGMKQMLEDTSTKTNEMHQVFTAGLTIKRAAVWTLGIVGSVALTASWLFDQYRKIRGK